MLFLKPRFFRRMYRVPSEFEPKERSMPETIKATELPIVDIFDDHYSFEIPDYQRPYAWTIDQAGELLDDLLYATRNIHD